MGPDVEYERTTELHGAASVLDVELGVRLEAIQAACKARKWTLIAPDGPA